LKAFYQAISTFMECFLQNDSMKCFLDVKKETGPLRVAYWNVHTGCLSVEFRK